MSQRPDSTIFDPAAEPLLPSAPRHGFGQCACHGGPTRRLFSGLLIGGAALASLPALAREGVEVGENSKFTKLVSAEQVEAAAQQQYQQMLRQAAQQRALAPPTHPQVQRLRAIADRIIPFAQPWNERARSWRWEVNLIGSPQLNAFCMPGGKIAFYYGILDKLQLNDDEVAMVMGHEVAHALREHARERMGKTAATRLGAGLISSLLGLGNVGDSLLSMGSQLLTLEFSRSDESEADLVGMELAARAGYNPEAGVSLWQKMGAASKGAPPQWLSTHPAGPTRIKDIEANLPKVQALYQRADKPPQRFEPAKPLRRKDGPSEGQ
ncbi:M48 family metallopeptidase [Paucibacter sp. APW11]|uniref:M48 family metallopeptidase n=1 Tax=Roseateles aquae TaxID=3077235 RepID=A0ABU3PI38_9BURK|nr:M48 family metallopeptidase [Paucibacter sp. APW11]MDT9002090.1 M48 family metallopeptidase [Paucibacter sp. APW11]